MFKSCCWFMVTLAPLIIIIQVSMDFYRFIQIKLSFGLVQNYGKDRIFVVCVKAI